MNYDEWIKAWDECMRSSGEIVASPILYGTDQTKLEFVPLVVEWKCDRCGTVWPREANKCEACGHWRTFLMNDESPDDNPVATVLSYY